MEPRHHHISMQRGGSGALSMQVRGCRGGASVARAGSVGSAAEAEWQIPPEDIMICKDPYGRDWQLGTGGFGSVRAAGHTLSGGASSVNPDAACSCPGHACVRPPAMHVEEASWGPGSAGIRPGVAVQPGAAGTSQQASQDVVAIAWRGRP